MTSPAGGVTAFARYAFPPNQLGYCGPADADVLLDHATSGHAEVEVAERASQFDGAWVYLQALGSAAGLDPLDPRVVEAYWLGNDLLGAVDPNALLPLLQRRFRGQAGGLLSTVPASPHVLANHGFHVFVVYPWSRLLGAGGDVPLSVLQACRIRWGTVVSVAAERAEVSSRPLVWDGSRLTLGAAQLESVRWSADGRSLHAGPAIGDVVSMHWDWVCERLTPVQATAVIDATAHALQLTNEMLSGSRPLG